MRSRVGAKFKELHGEVVRFVSGLRRPYPDDWIHPVVRSFDAFQQEAYRFRFDAHYATLQERPRRATRELEAFMKNVRELPPGRTTLPRSGARKLGSLIDRCVALLLAETARRANPSATPTSYGFASTSVRSCSPSIASRG